MNNKNITFLDVYDNSGVRLYVTKEYRPIEFAILTVGALSSWNGILVPPYVDRFPIDYYCKKEALNVLKITFTYL